MDWIIGKTENKKNQRKTKDFKLILLFSVFKLFLYKNE